MTNWKTRKTKIAPKDVQPGSETTVQPENEPQPDPVKDETPEPIETPPAMSPPTTAPRRGAPKRGAGGKKSAIVTSVKLNVGKKKITKKEGKEEEKQADPQQTQPINTFIDAWKMLTPVAVEMSANHPVHQKPQPMPTMTTPTSKLSKLKNLDPKSSSLQIDDIEEHIIYDLTPFNVTKQEKFVESVTTFYENHNFDEDDITTLKLLWNNDKVQNLHSKFLASEINRIREAIEEKQKSVDEKREKAAENRKRKGDSTFDLPVKHVRTRSIICHDMSVMHLRYCSLCKKDLKSYDEAVDHLYDALHVNKLAECFARGSQPRVTMKVIQCNVCNTKPYEAPDLNSAFFDHISSYAHAVNGVSPPKKLSKQLELTAKANLCAYYVNKEIPTNLAQQAAGHIIGHASSSIFMSSGKRQLTKADMKLHPLRITGNLADAEDNAYKSAAFSTFCMTQGMTADHVKKMWNWQPLFLPMMHIRGKCGLCKCSVENSLDSERAVAGLAKNLHISSEEHKNYCSQEWKDIDKRLGIDIPADVKCFLISYCDLCQDSLGQWNSILSHVLGAKHRKRVEASMTPWQPGDVIEIDDEEDKAAFSG